MSEPQKPQPQQKQERPPLTFVDVKTFTDKETGFTVIVSRSETERPWYTMRQGWTKPDGKFTVHRQFRTTIKDNIVSFVPLKASVIASVYAQAEVFCQQAKQEEEDRFIEKKMSRQFKTYKHTGKTARKRERERASNQDTQ